MISLQSTDVLEKYSRKQSYKKSLQRRQYSNFVKTHKKTRKVLVSAESWKYCNIPHLLLIN